MLQIFIILLISHIFCEYIIMPDFLLVGKSKTVPGVVIHSIIVAIVTFITVFYFFGNTGWPLALILTVSHIFIDLIRPIFFKKLKAHNFIYFVVDQALHIGILYYAATIAVDNSTPLAPATNDFITMALVFLVGIFTAPLFSRMYAKAIVPSQYKKRGVMQADEVLCDALYGIAIVIMMITTTDPAVIASGIFTSLILYILTTWSLAKLAPKTAIIKGIFMTPFVIIFTYYFTI